MIIVEEYLDCQLVTEDPSRFIPEKYIGKSLKTYIKGTNKETRIEIPKKYYYYVKDDGYGYRSPSEIDQTDRHLGIDYQNFIVKVVPGSEEVRKGDILECEDITLFVSGVKSIQKI